jgi:dihydroxyacetone kinase phosphotransfer subunit
LQLRTVDGVDLPLSGGVSTRMNNNGANVGIVIVSHSPLIARGTADMVRQMVGDSVPLAWCGGNAEGGLGTNARDILRAITSAWSEAGVAVFVDLGGAETNSEMAIEMLEPARARRVLICNAPIVEGAVMAAAEASGGAALVRVVATAEELSP